MFEDEFNSRAVLVTGAAEGIGRELAGALAAAGANLLLVDIEETALERAADELKDALGTVDALVADVGDEEAVERLADEAFRRAGRIDCLINCAGIFPVTPLLELTSREWDRVMTVNLRGPFLMIRAIGRHMVDAGISGRILNVSSGASTVARPGIAHYGASKAGLNQLTRVAAVELAAHGIRVNAILPGVIETGPVLRSLDTFDGRAEGEAKRARIPLGRFGRTQELVDLSLFLLSDASSYCTGGLYTVDGGYSLGIATYGPQEHAPDSTD